MIPFIYLQFTAFQLLDALIPWRLRELMRFQSRPFCVGITYDSVTIVEGSKEMFGSTRRTNGHPWIWLSLARCALLVALLPIDGLHFLDVCLRDKGNGSIESHKYHHFSFLKMCILNMPIINKAFDFIWSILMFPHIFLCFSWNL